MITNQNVNHLASGNAVEAAHKCHLNWQVDWALVLPDGGSFAPIVNAAALVPHQKNIPINQPDEQNLHVVGCCTWPMYTNCKYATVTLFSFQDDLKWTDMRVILGYRNQLSFRCSLYSILLWTFLNPSRSRLLQTQRSGKASDQVGLLRLGILSLYPCESNRSANLDFATRQARPMANYNPGQAMKLTRPSDSCISTKFLRPDLNTGNKFVGTFVTLTATKRRLWSSCQGTLLAEGNFLNNKLSCKRSTDRRQTLKVELSKNLLQLGQGKPWYLDPFTGVLGLVAARLPTLGTQLC